MGWLGLRDLTNQHLAFAQDCVPWPAAARCMHRPIGLQRIGKNIQEKTMAIDLNAGAVAASSTKPLWAVVGVLGLAVVGMGGAMLSMKSKPEAPTPAAAMAVPTAPVAPVPAIATTPSASPVTEQKTAESRIEPAKTATKNIAKHVTPKAATGPASVPAVVTTPAVAAVPSPAPVAAVVPAPVPVVAVATPAPKPICGNCGTIDGITPVQHQGKANGLGAVAGGVAGALLGHQVGDGTGKQLATVLGGVAGGLAGNALEKNAKKVTVYSVHLSMEDGSSRTVELQSAPPMGTKVIVDGNTLRGTDGSILGGPAPAAAKPVAADPGRNNYGG